MSRWRIVPDLDGELSAVLNVLEDLLLLLKGVHSSEGLAVAGPSPAAPLVLSAAAEAVARLHRAVVPSQGLSGQPGRGRLLAPYGRYEHLPMSQIEIDPGDIDVVAEVTDLLSTCPAPRAVTNVADAVASELLRPLPGCLAPVADRAATFAHLQRAVALLQVTAPGETAIDIAVLRWPLTLAASGLDVALTEAQEAAYQRLASQFNAIWADGSALGAFLY